MRVAGDEAKACSAVRLDTFGAIEGNGVLVMADDQTGEVQWRDKANSQKGVVLGARAIRILPRRVYGR